MKSGIKQEYHQSSADDPAFALEYLLAVLDFCVGDNSPSDPDDRRAIIEAIEGHLAAIVPTNESDFFLLAGRLTDRSLSQPTRDAIAGNIAKAALLMTSRLQRWNSWLCTFTSAVTLLRGLQSDASDWCEKGLQLCRSTRTGLDQSAEAIEECQDALDAAILEIESAKGILVFADLMFGDEVARLNRLVVESNSETKLFVEASAATMH
jgi:hypothetical protein